MTFDADDALPLGTEVAGRYRTLAIVGRGGVGTVYKVSDVLSGTTYALKELANPSASARKQFENEAQWLQALNHHNIPRVREFFEWENRVYLVMEFIEGENLEQMLGRLGGRPLPEAQVISWTLPICEALYYLHSQQPPILHRDVKPANIIVTPAGHPVLVDLGIAKEHLPGAGMTATFVKKAGTEGYAPPEQYTTAGKTGPWSDVYGMGATLYELLTGTVPPTAVERVALDSPMSRPRALNPAISPYVDDAVIRALALRPADRFQSMPDLARALRGESRMSAPSLAARPSGSVPGSYAQARPSPSMTPPSGLSGGFAGIPANPGYAGAAGYGGMPGISGPSGALSELPALDRPLANSPAAFSSPRSPLPSLTPSHSSPSTGTYPALRGAVMPPIGQARGSRGDSGPASRRSRKTKPVASIAVEETAQGTARSRSLRLLGIFGLLVVLGVAVTFVAVYALGIFAPLDRSTPQATATGYFKALSAQDYSRAWQYASISHSDPTSEANFAGGLRADDDHLGRITSVGAAQVAQDSPSSARATVVVQRGGDAGTQMTYTLSMTLYDGNTWLIDSVTVS